MKALATNKLFLIILFSFVLSSCRKDFLDVPDTTSILRQEYVKDLSSLNDYLNGIYILLSTDYYHAYNLIYADLIADDLRLPATTSTFLARQYNWDQTADEVQATTPTNNPPNMNPVWTTGYKIVRSCNFVIGQADLFKKEDLAKGNSIKGQALAIRAMVLHQLANMFAQPYNLTPNAAHPGIPYPTSPEISEPVHRNTVAEVYEHLTDDLQNAIESLTVPASNKSIISQTAAKALLARVYLFKGDYQKAKALSREVVTAVPIMTGTNYPSKLFTKDESEAIFQLTPASTLIGNAYNTTFPARYFVSPKRFVATADIASLLKQHTPDVRSGWVNLAAGTWNVVKFPSGVIAGFNPPSGSYYHTLIRSSEMCLTAAEAYYKINNEDSARFYLDAIRLRADPTAIPSLAAGTALRDTIYEERRKELCFEGFRMFDLLRTGRGVDRIDAVGATAKHLPFPSLKAVAPIPTLDVRMANLPQNESY